jgi:hypothetical protein
LRQEHSFCGTAKTPLFGQRDNRFHLLESNIFEVLVTHVFVRNINFSSLQTNFKKKALNLILKKIQG